MNHQEFAETNDLGFTFAKTETNPSMDATHPMDHYLIGIYIRPEGEDQRLFTLYYSKGVGHKGKPPEITEVLNCLQMDASMLDQAADFEDWAADLGYDADSRSAETIYKGCVEQTTRLKNFLGEDLFNDFLMLDEED
jgi:hypothetical protein